MEIPADKCVTFNSVKTVDEHGVGHWHEVTDNRCPFFSDAGGENNCSLYEEGCNAWLYNKEGRVPQCLADFPHGAVVELKKKESEKTGNDPKEKDGKDVTMDIHGRERGTPSAYDDADWF